MQRGQNVSTTAVAIGTTASIVALVLAMQQKKNVAAALKRARDAIVSKIWTSVKGVPFTPESVNWHFLRTCNYQCRFCFHTNIDGNLVKIQDAQRGLRMLAEAGMKKLNLSGGEPFLQKKFLGQVVRFCKEDLHLESVTIVSNGSCIDANWMAKFGKYVDILAISCDSLTPETLRAMGRQNKQGDVDHIDQMLQVRQWCREYNVVFKMNTVVTSCNFEEDLSEHILKLDPARWKVFQVLPIEGENTGENPTNRSADDLLVDSSQFDSYIERHRQIPAVANVLVPEDNAHMRDSYLILDEHMRFLNCTSGKKVPTKSILETDLASALKAAGHDADMYLERGGRYVWNREQIQTGDIEDLTRA